MHQDSVTLLRPTLLGATSLGLCPRLKNGITHSLYLLLLSFAPFIALKTRIANQYSLYYDISCFVVIMDQGLLMIQHVAILLETFKKREVIQQFWSAMESAQQILFLLNIRQPTRPSLLSQVLWLLGGFTPFVFIIFESFYEFNIPNLIYLVTICIVHSGTVIKLRVMLDLINEKYSLLNWHLDDLNNRWPLFLPRPPDVTFSEFSCVSSYRRTKFVNYDRDVRKVTADKIRLFNKAHFLLYYSFKTLNEMYSLSGFFLTLTGGCTFASVAIANSVSQTNKLLTILIPAQVFIFLLTIFTYSTLINEKSGRTAHLVHDLLDEDGHDPEVIEELEEFSKALLHRKVNFSASGFFDMDLKLVSRMASMLAPITIFLVQNTTRPHDGHTRPPQ